MSAYRARGHRNGNLWLVYSYKTDRDWIIASDRKLVHWLTFLESNPDVCNFDLSPEQKVDIAEANNVVACDAVAILRDQTTQFHILGNENNFSYEKRTSSLETLEKEAATQCINVTEHDLKNRARLAVRWLKPMGYVSAIRGKDHIATRNALISHIKREQSGTIENTIKSLNGHEAPILQGVLVRLAIEGFIRLDLSDGGFGIRTKWLLITDRA